MRQIIAAILAATALLCAGCSFSQTQSSTVESVEISADQSAFIWKIDILKREKQKELKTTRTTTLYDGSVEEVPYQDIPAQGKQFLLLELQIEKSKPGNFPFEWDKVLVVDANGKEYARHANDNFLTKYQYNRIAATSLKMGTTTGWICFEIDSEAAKGSLYLVHKTDEGENKILI